jgi:hypothetical protein
MRHARLLSSLAMVAGLVFAGGCGGGGHGFGGTVNPLKITSADIPDGLSGQVVNYLIPFEGGAGGPYHLEVIDGVLPRGITLDDATVAIAGRPLEDGNFHFTLMLSDAGSQPFGVGSQTYDWFIGQGPLQILTDANLPPWTYNKYDAVALLIAGGAPPYSCQVIDQPLVIDEPLPQGLSIPNQSSTIEGAPTEQKGAQPYIFQVSIEARDHANDLAFPNPQRVVKLFTITVLVPDLIIVTTTVKDGKIGTDYIDKIEVADGIPPFSWHIVDADNSPTLMMSEPSHPSDGVAKGTPLGYPSDFDPGTSYPGKFPEGLYIRESTGDISGKPRRVGSFTNWWVLVHSDTLPGEPNQNKWRAYSFSMIENTPPALALNASVLQAGSAFGATAPNFLPSMSAGTFYTRTFTATGGVPQDGKWDSPHETYANTPGNTETVGAYSWGSFFPPVALPIHNPPDGVTFNAITATLSGTPASYERSATLRTMFVSTTDSRLPLPLPASHQVAGTQGQCQYEVGPDYAIITETSTGSGATSMDNSMDFNSQTVEVFEPGLSPVVRPLNDSKDMAPTHVHPLGGTLAGSLTSIDFLLVSVNPTWWAYDVYNLNAKAARAMQHNDPERACQGAAYGSDYSQKESYTTACMGTNSPNLNGYEHPANPAIELPYIPTTASSVSPLAAPSGASGSGTYVNGGLLYAYDRTNEFGFFIVRKDSKIQIPVAFAKPSAGGLYTGFGDGWVNSSTGVTQMLRVPQITVSPDGRWAAAKLKVNINSFVETQRSAGTQQAIVVFSLAGEKPAAWGGSTFKVFAAGGSASNPTTTYSSTPTPVTTGDGAYIYADSLALTNRYLYFLKGNNVGGPANYQDRVIYGEHWVYRLDFLDGAVTTAGLMGLPAGTNTGGWVNTAGNPVSTTYCRWSTPGSSSLLGFATYRFASASGSYQMETTYGTDSPVTTSPTGIAPDFLAYNWANFHPTSMAPMPFRVSANGAACAIVAGSNQPLVSASAGSSVFLQYGVYVDYWDGAATTTFNDALAAGTGKRRFKGPTRIGGLRAGPENSTIASSNRTYGIYDGPATQFEISDDGKVVGAVYNSSANTWYTVMGTNMGYPTTYATSPPDQASREDLLVLRGIGAATNPWGTLANNFVTGSNPTTAANMVFPNSPNNINWRFGCLHFSRDNNALVFWGGYTCWFGYYAGGTAYYSYYYFNADIKSLTGSMYAYTINAIGTTPANTVEGILQSSLGGHQDVSGTSTVYKSTGAGGTPCNFYSTTFGGTHGKIVPSGCFATNDGNMYYVDSYGPLVTDGIAHRLVGINVKSSNTAVLANPDVINNKVPLRGFLPTFPNSRGFFSPTKTYYYMGTQEIFKGPYGGTMGHVGSHISAGATAGTLFFQAHAVNYYSSPTQLFAYPLGDYYYGPGAPNAVAWYDFGQYYSGEVYAMKADIGGDAIMLSSLGAPFTFVQRTLTYIQPSPDGTKVIFQHVRGTSYYDHAPQREQVVLLSNITFNATGTTATANQIVLEGTDGRASSSMAIDAAGKKIYYGFVAAGSSENQMKLKEIVLDATQSGVSATNTSGGISGPTARFVVINNAR